MSQLGSQSAGQKIQTFFFRHWEKIVFGIAALSLVAFFYFGRAKTFKETTPQALNQLVQNAEQYISDSSGWDKIDTYRQGNETAAATIANERTVKPDWYQVATISGTPMKTRGLRADPEIKTPLESNAELVVGSVVVNKPNMDYWDTYSAAVEGTTADSAEETGGGDDFGGGVGGRRGGMRRGGGAAETAADDKQPALSFPDIQQQEELGVAVTKLGINSAQHTPKVVSAVCVTGLFPHELQVQEFSRCFMDSVSYSAKRDKPQYARLEIQRRKMVDGAEGEWEDITSFVTEILPRQFYAAQGPEIVEESFVDPVLTMRVPPFVFANFRDFVAHEKVPKIKVPEPTSPADAMAMDTPSTLKISELRQAQQENSAESRESRPKENPMVDKTEIVPGYKLVRFFDMFDFNVEPQTKVQYRFRVWLADPNMYNPQVMEQVASNSADERDQSQALSALEGGDTGSTGGVGAKGAAAGVGAKGNRANAPAAGGSGSESSQVDFLQLAPDVRERLRKLDDQQFDAGDEWKRFCRPSEWSPETEWVSLPRNSAEIVAGRVDYPTVITSAEGVEFTESEPEIQVAAKKWDPALHVPVAAAQKVARASVLNFRGNGLVFNPITRKLYELDRNLIDDVDATTGVNFNTESFVVDVTGGQKMPYSSVDKAYYFPSEIIVMDGNGNLQVRNASQDRQEYRHSLFLPDESLSDVEPKREEPKEEEDGDSGSQFGGRGR